MRILWFLAITATLVFALSPSDSGGAGGSMNHVLAFVVLGILTRLSFDRLDFPRSLVLLAALGGAIEIAQLYMGMGRNADWRDWIVDVAAAAIGLLLGSLISSRGKRA